MLTGAGKVGSVVWRDGKKIRVDFGFKKLTVEYSELELAEMELEPEPEPEPAAPRSPAAHPRQFFDDQAKSAQEAADAAFARRLAMMTDDEQLALALNNSMDEVETDPQEQLALAQSLNDAAVAAARQQATQAAARQQRDRPPAQAAHEPAEPYEAEWGERPDVHDFNAADFDIVGNTSWGLHGALPLMRAVGRVLNELHRPVEVYKEASRALLNLMAANAEADGTVEKGEAEFTNYHDYLDEGLEEGGDPSATPKLERIFSPKEERAPSSQQVVALASPGSGTVVLAALEPASNSSEVMRARERREIQELADSAEELLQVGFPLCFCDFQ